MLCCYIKKFLYLFLKYLNSIRIEINYIKLFFNRFSHLDVIISPLDLRILKRFSINHLTMHLKNIISQTFCTKDTKDTQNNNAKFQNRNT